MPLKNKEKKPIDLELNPGHPDHWRTLFICIKMDLALITYNNCDIKPNQTKSNRNNTIAYKLLIVDRNT